MSLEDKFDTFLAFLIASIGILPKGTNPHKDNFSIALSLRNE